MVGRRWVDAEERRAERRGGGEQEEEEETGPRRTREVEKAKQETVSDTRRRADLKMTKVRRRRRE